jgi:ribosomal-protein-alanine N-acetyltransferase
MGWLLDRQMEVKGSMTIPTITTPRLKLRSFAAGDVDPMFDILNQEGVLRYFPVADPPARDRVAGMIRRLINHWEERGYGLWAVESRADGMLMGRCGLQYLLDTDEVEVDFILGRPFWGQGFATEAARAGVRYGFEALDIDGITGIAHVENRGSQRVLEKLGMDRIEQKQFFGMECYRYRVDRKAYHAVSQMWKRNT